MRTSSEGKKQAGISFLLIDMKSEGVEVKPMLTLGETPAFCDTFFTNVKVPKENLLGPLNGGWNLAKALLGHERTLVGAVGIVERGMRLARRIAAEQVGDDGRPLLEDPHFRSKLARLEMRLRAHRMANYRTLAVQAKGHHPGPESSILKLVGSVLTQLADELCMELMGHNQLSWLNEPGAVPGLRALGVASTLLLRPRDDHLRGQQRDSEEHHREAHSRAPEEVGTTMDFDLNEDQKMFSEDGRRASAKKDSTVERFRKLRETEGEGWDRKVWQQMGELGWLSVPFPRERRVASAASSSMRRIILEQLGKTLVPEPYLSCAILGGYSLLLGGSEAQQKRFLAPMIEGQTAVALAWAERQSRFDPARIQTTATKDGSRLAPEGREGLRARRACCRPARRERQDRRRHRPLRGRGGFGHPADAQAHGRAPRCAREARRRDRRRPAPGRQGRRGGSLARARLRRGGDGGRGGGRDAHDALHDHRAT